MAEAAKVDYVKSSGVALICAIVVLVIQTALRGLAILVTWNWFISEVFHVQPLNFFYAIGMSLFFSALFPYVGRPWSTWQKISDWNLLKEDIFRTVAGPVAVGGVALLWHFLGTL